MKLIVCAEERFGLLFHNRRVSRDRVVTDKILAITSGSTLWTNSFSAGLFPGEAPITVDEAFLERAQKQDYCFLEKGDVRPYASRVEELILFRWNRRYPFDVSFPFGECFGSWQLVSSEDFPGNSHESITMEVYRP